MKKFLSLLCALTLVVCSVSLVGVASADDMVDVTVWDTSNGFLPVGKGSALYNTYVELTGVGVIQPYVEWNGGTTYKEQLNLKIAAGEMPDMFNPNGMETQLIESGALLDLTPYLETYAPNLYNLIGEEVWASVRANDPTGEGKIWYIPSVIYGRNAPMIRQDWLDNLGLSMPTTQSELVEVLKAFRDQDPNGDGIFGNYGWSEGVCQEKYLAEHFMVRGIHHFVPHAFSAQPFPDKDCPPHFYAHGNNPQYRHFGALIRYMERVSHLISGGHSITHAAILYHAEADWTGGANQYAGAVGRVLAY